jgi:hypothetical protein
MKRRLTTLILITYCFLLLTLTGNAQSKQAILRPQIDHLVNKLKQEKIVHFGYAVGFSAVSETKNKYYKFYQRLKRKATNTELIVLTNDFEKCMVVYAFSILHDRQYEQLKDIFLAHTNDTTYYWTARGCTGSLNRVNWFMLRRLSWKNEHYSKEYLTPEEFAKYCAIFSKQGKFYICN